MRLRNIPGAGEVIGASDFVVQHPEGFKGRWKAQIFGNDHPLELEIGIGKGRFLMDLAEQHPEINYLGIELYSSVLVRAIQKAEQRVTGSELALPVGIKERPGRPDDCNFRLIRYDATDLIQLFVEGEIDKIYLNFSDPWPKDRHADRRLTSARFLQRYEQILAKEGTLACKTDNHDLFTYSLEQLQACGWNLLYHTFDLHGVTENGKKPDPVLEKIRAENHMTEYEEKFAAAGVPIGMFLAARP